jgi:hypothetical protein
MIAATAMNSQAVVVTNATVLESATFALTATSQGSYATNRKGTLITAFVTNSSIKNKEVINAISLATGTNFPSTAMLVRYKIFSQTNYGYEYEIASTNVTALSTNGVFFSTNLERAVASFEVPFVLTNGVTNSTSNTIYGGLLLGSNFTRGQTNVVALGVTNTTVFTFLTNILALANTTNGYEIIDRTNTVILSNTIFSTSANNLKDKGTDMALDFEGIFAANTGTEYSIGGVELIAGNTNLGGGWVFGVAGFETDTIVSQNVEPTHVAPEYIDYASPSTLNAYGTGSMYIGTNIYPVVIQGTVTWNLYKTILKP